MGKGYLKKLLLLLLPVMSIFTNNEIKELTHFNSTLFLSATTLCVIFRAGPSGDYPL